MTTNQILTPIYPLTITVMCIISLLLSQHIIAADNPMMPTVIYTVNVTDDTDDGQCNSTHCSFREAVSLSNGDGMLSEIRFDISGVAPHIIIPGAGFPEVLDSLIIDGTTQPGWTKGDIVIDGILGNEDGTTGNHYLNGNNPNTISGNAGFHHIEVYGLHIKNFFYSGLLIYKSAIIGDDGKGNIFTSNATYGNLAFSGGDAIDIDSNLVISDVLIQGNDFGVANGVPGTNRNESIVVKQQSAGVIILDNHFENEGRAVNLYFTLNTELTIIKDNTFFNCTDAINTERNVELTSNQITDCNRAIFLGFGDDFDKECIADSNYVADCFYGLYLEPTNATVTLSNNRFHSSEVAFFIDAGFTFEDDYTLTFDNDTFTCNNTVLDFLDFTNSNDTPPVITHTTENEVFGTCNIVGTNQTIEVYLVDESLCQGSSTCQGSISIGTAILDNNGNFSITVDSTLNAGTRLAIRSQAQFMENGLYYENSTNFNCFIVQPDICETAKVLVVNPEECATTGAVVDMEILTDSGQGTGSSCDGSYVSNDAWFKIESPDSWNSLVRVNINNAINGVAEAYIGTCGNLVLSQCIELDSVPFAMILDDFTPGTDIYIRVWDRDNTVVSTGTGALLHFTAHELDPLKANWEICDVENNLINGNPTILSERDANKFIIEYEMGATAAEMQVIRDSLIMNGGTKVDSFVCGPQVLELWDHDNPVDMEENTRGARGRARVDTTNYNYVFEQLEFQLNAYADGEQYNSNTSMDDEGNFIVIWEDLERRNIFMRVYSSSGNPITKELRVGSQSSTQHNAQTELYSNGDFVTTWHESSPTDPQFSIYCRLWNADGTPKAVPFNLSILASQNPGRINDAKHGTDPSLASNASDDFVVTWHHANRIFFLRFDSSGNRLGNPMEVGVDILHGNDPDPKVDMNASGEFVIVYNGIDSNGKGIYAQRYDSSGATVGNLIAVNTYTTGEQSGADVSMATDSSFIVSWHSLGQDGSDYGIYAKRYDANGVAIGTEFLVNTYTTDAQKDPTITQLDDGTFFIAWSSFGQDGFEEGIFGQFYDNTGATIGAEFQLNVLDDPEQENPSVATNGSSIVLATWEDGINDGDGKGIFGQRYEIIDAGGQKVFYPIGTATPSTLLGDEQVYPGTIYTPQDSVSNVRVAIIDTGVDPNHPYLAGAMWNNQQAGAGCFPKDTLGYDFVNETYDPIDYDGHGTRVNGIIARDFPSDIQLELMNLKFHEFQKGKVFDAVSAIYYAVDNGADIINMSWGFEASEFPAILRKAVEYASDNGVLLVTTAGNTSKNNDIINKYPCNFIDTLNIIKVTSYEYNATTNVRKLANYASYGANNVDIAAYGFVESPTLGDTLGLSSGTSLAAPQVTRTAAIIKGLFPKLTADQIKDCILNTSEAESDFADKVATGGVLDHDAAIDCAYEKAGNCVAIDLYITLPQTMDTTFRSDAWITTDASITSASDIELYGAEHVTMLPGFETILGVEYLADIDDCDPMNSPLTQPSQNETSALRLRETSVMAGKIKLQFYYSDKKVSIDLKDESGKVIDTYVFQPEKEGWYEKIIDCKVLKSGIYQIELQGEKEDKESRYFQIYNQQYEKYKNLSRTEDE